MRPELVARNFLFERGGVLGEVPMWPERIPASDDDEAHDHSPRTCRTCGTSRGLKTNAARPSGMRDRARQARFACRIRACPRSGTEDLAHGKRRATESSAATRNTPRSFERHVRGERQHDRDDDDLRLPVADPDSVLDRSPSPASCRSRRANRPGCRRAR